MVRLVLVLLAVAALGVRDIAAEGETKAYWDVPEVDLAAIIEGRESSIPDIRRALAKDGILAITNIPAVTKLRKETFHAAAECLPELSDAPRAEFADGVRRVSVGARTVYHALQDWQDESLQQSSNPACKSFRNLSQKLRRAVLSTQQLFVSRLDKICDLDTDASAPLISLQNSLENGTEAAQLSNLQSVVDNGSQLEHVHIYQGASKSVDSDDSSLDLHLDAGLFIMFIPALHTEAGSTPRETDFTLELANGEHVTPVFPDDGNAIVIMIGAAFERLLNPRARIPLRAAPHELRVSQNATRVWYGKMFLPSEDAHYTAENQSFKQIHAAQVEAFRSELASSPAYVKATTASMGCTDVFAMVTEQSKQCGKNELFCWMKCMQKPAKQCSKNEAMVCAKPNGNPWEPKTHCTDCLPRCVAQAPEVVGNDFCNGYGTVMYMERLVGWADPDEACLVLFFDALKLDTRTKYVSALVAVFFFGVLTDYLSSLRRKLETHAREQKGKKTRFMIIRGLMHFVQLSFAYIAMLFAMTYSILIMVSIVAGLATGHVLFNMKHHVSEHVEPCCAITCDDSASSTSYDDTFEDCMYSSTNEEPLLSHTQHSSPAAGGSYDAIFPARELSVPVQQPQAQPEHHCCGNSPHNI
mmetsp:Transcript_22675/g.44493  ORF Transcript_22675/g.44493 Transcript_22675/m.44493 type:complete len:641 (+) Transcript_22675:323-2245(+)|eukprot:CAMPEP_0171495294 /NCGR_PEP_ID=MMETSP0958-20121227/6068_1 /TAXON_ID=87120 /ORGANISM="Aurantiochytrium limacinum, Strain ATCCMYA-1381" /LENGTH=640 /DNA_ID=CAMNT_0012029273 /DNA_START=305 /DNA_END=2227 /DNA_ORIENTATION=-